MNKKDNLTPLKVTKDILPQNSKYENKLVTKEGSGDGNKAQDGIQMNQCSGHPVFVAKL